MQSKLRYSKHTLEKIEQFLEEAGYSVRYEKGNFQSGSCVLESKKMIIVNRFFETEGRIIALLDIIHQLPLDEAILSAPALEFYLSLKTEIEKSEMV